MYTLIWMASALAAGVLARTVTKSRGRGFIGDTVLGMLGSVSGAWLLRLVVGEVRPGGFANVATAFVGAVCLVAAGRPGRTIVQGAGQLAGERVGGVLPDIEAELRRLTDTERTVLSRVIRRQGLPRDPSESFSRQLSFGERLADRVADFGGSWTFIGFFAAFMLAWMYLNTATPRPVDPYPFILLNLVLSRLAAVQAPIIMTSQNRRATETGRRWSSSSSSSSKCCSESSCRWRTGEQRRRRTYGTIRRFAGATGMSIESVSGPLW